MEIEVMDTQSGHVVTFNSVWEVASFMKIPVLAVMKFVKNNGMQVRDIRFVLGVK